jgi:hypothetical protein
MGVVQAELEQEAMSLKLQLQILSQPGIDWFRFLTHSRPDHRSVARVKSAESARIRQSDRRHFENFLPHRSSPFEIQREAG